jgi:hypothetical protein
VAAIVLDASTFGDRSRTAGDISGLMAQGVEIYLVRQGDDIGSALDSKVGILR